MINDKNLIGNAILLCLLILVMILGILLCLLVLSQLPVLLNDFWNPRKIFSFLFLNTFFLGTAISCFFILLAETHYKNLLNNKYIHYFYSLIITYFWGFMIFIISGFITLILFILTNSPYFAYQNSENKLVYNYEMVLLIFTLLSTFIVSSIVKENIFIKKTAR